MNHNIVQIDIENWQEKLNDILGNENVSFETRDDIIDTMIDNDLSPSDMAKILIAAKNRGLIKDDKVWKTHKKLLSRGGHGDLDGLIALRRITKNLANGKELVVREFVGPLGRPPTEEEGGDNKTQKNSGFVKQDTNEARRIVVNYIEKRIVGAIYSRFAILAGHEDLRPIADYLIDEINRIVDELS